MSYNVLCILVVALWCPIVPQCSPWPVDFQRCTLTGWNAGVLWNVEVPVVIAALSMQEQQDCLWTW